MAEAVERTDVREARSGAYAGWAERRHALTIAFVLMLGIAALVRILLTRQIPAPWILGDELHYSELAKSFASDGVMRLREEPSTIRSLYPVLVSPAAVGWQQHGCAVQRSGGAREREPCHQAHRHRGQGGGAQPRRAQPQRGRGQERQVDERAGIAGRHGQVLSCPSQTTRPWQMVGSQEAALGYFL